MNDGGCYTEPMQHFAQISDPHLTTLEGAQARDLLNKRALGFLSWRRKRRFEHRPEVLAALLQDLRQQAQGLCQLLVTGDLTHIGLPQEFAEAARWLRTLGEPRDVALVPGNHDTCVPTAWDSSFALWAPYMASDAEARSERFPTLRVRGDLAFIGVSTAVPTPPLMATGTAGDAQIARLAGVLRDTGARGLFRVVYLHHCPLSGEEQWRKRLTDAPALQAALADNGAELVLHGHGHRGHRRRLATRDGDAPVIAVPSASALGLHGKDVAGYNCYAVSRETHGWTLTIAERTYDTASGTFVAGERTQLAISRARAAA
ncbi:MAG: metallophosphoesterase [Halioglobus sp.]